MTARAIASPALPARPESSIVGLFFEPVVARGQKRALSAPLTPLSSPLASGAGG